MLENYSDWSGNIDDLRSTAHQLIEENEIEEAKLLWNSLIADLKQVLGSS